MLLLILPMAKAQDKTVQELDLAKGSITITSTGYTQGEGELQTYSGAYRITQTDAENTTTANTVTVESGQHEIELAGVNIKITRKEAPALSPFVRGLRLF